jgi:hypothetical protein
MTFLVPSSLWLVTWDFSCAIVAIAQLERHLRRLGLVGHPSSDVLSSLDSFVVMFHHHHMLGNLAATFAKACAIVAFAQRERRLRTFFCHYQLCSK